MIISETRIKILNFLLSLDDPDFKMAQLRDALPTLDRQTIYYHLKELTRLNLITREGKGHYRLGTHEAIVNHLSDQISQNSTMRAMFPTKFIPESVTADLNRQAKRTRALKRAGIPLGTIWETAYKARAKESIKELQQFINLFNTSSTSMHDAMQTIHNDLDWDEVEQSLRKNYPETWENHLDHFREVANHGRTR